MMTSKDRTNMINSMLVLTSENGSRMSFLRFYGIVFAIFATLIVLLGLPGAFFLTIVLGTAQQNITAPWAMQIHTIVNVFWGFFSALLAAKFVSFMANGIFSGMLENTIEDEGYDGVSNAYVNTYNFVLPAASLVTFIGVIWYFITYLPVAL
jgi:hypothetical protein